MPNVSDIYNFEQLRDNVSTSGQPRAEEFASLRAHGVDAVINLALPTSDNALDNEGSLVTNLGMSYHQIPVDFAAPTEDELRVFGALLDGLAHKNVHVHCAMNLRVSAFMFRYLTERGVDDAAATTVIMRRWLPKMDAVWRAFSRHPDA
ncbi:MAG: protein tyrosine phosphatase family protein [Pseudomonadota bacterium]